MRRPTIQDVAEVAKVSLSTVDRVLNKRGGVSIRAVKRVEEAILKTGYIRDLAAANLSRNRAYRIKFLVPDSDTTFLGSIVDAVTGAQQRMSPERVDIRLERVAAFNGEAYRRALAAIDPDSIDGVILMAVESPGVMEEVGRLRSAGKHIITLVSDLPHSARRVYVGPNNVAAGRTAAAFMGKLIRAGRGEIVIISGANSVRDHVERRLGFEAMIRDYFPRFAVRGARESHDDPAITYELVREAITSGDVVGVYSVGGGSRGVMRAVADLDGTPRPITITHELTPSARTGLRENLIDLVIDQDPAGEVRRAISLLRELIDGHEVDPAAGLIQPHIYISENMP